jgi:hypothetical protein
VSTSWGAHSLSLALGRCWPPWVWWTGRERQSSQPAGLWHGHPSCTGSSWLPTCQGQRLLHAWPLGGACRADCPAWLHRRFLLLAEGPALQLTDEVSLYKAALSLVPRGPAATEDKRVHFSRCLLKSIPPMGKTPSLQSYVLKLIFFESIH